MKPKLLTLLAFFALTALAAAQEKQDVTQRHQPVVTEKQVERDEQLARQERRKAEDERKALLEKQKTEERRQVSDREKNTPASTRKTSTRTGEQ